MSFLRVWQIPKTSTTEDEKRKYTCPHGFSKKTVQENLQCRTIQAGSRYRHIFSRKYMILKIFKEAYLALSRLIFGVRCLAVSKKTRKKRFVIWRNGVVFDMLDLLDRQFIGMLPISMHFVNVPCSNLRGKY